MRWQAPHQPKPPLSASAPTIIQKPTSSTQSADSGHLRGRDQTTGSTLSGQRGKCLISCRNSKHSEWQILAQPRRNRQHGHLSTTRGELRPPQRGPVCVQRDAPWDSSAAVRCRRAQKTCGAVTAPTRPFSGLAAPPRRMPVSKLKARPFVARASRQSRSRCVNSLPRRALSAVAPFAKSRLHPSAGPGGCVCATLTPLIRSISLHRSGFVRFAPPIGIGTMAENRP